MDFLVQILYNSDMEKITFTVDKDMRLVDALTGKGFSFGQANKLVKNKDVRVNGEKVSTNIKVCSGSEIIAFYSGEVAPNEQQIEVVFEDQNILVVNKPDGIEVEGKAGVAERLGALAVHRLDRNTTGLLVLAKNPSAQQALLQAFRQKLVEKRYLAEVVGATNFHNQKLSAFLVKNAEESKVKIFSSPVKGGVKISNIFNTVKSSTGASVVEIELLTGKTHQIRAYLAFLGHPIIGDGKYGKNSDNKKFKKRRQQLHCYFVAFSKLPPPLEYLSGKSFSAYPDFFVKKD